MGLRLQRKSRLEETAIVPSGGWPHGINSVTSRVTLVEFLSRYVTPSHSLQHGVGRRPTALQKVCEV